MSYRIIPTHRFEKEIKRLAKKFSSLKNEFAKLIKEITTNPESGTYTNYNNKLVQSACSFSSILPQKIVP